MLEKLIHQSDNRKVKL